MIFYWVKEKIRRWATYRDYEQEVDASGPSIVFTNKPVSKERGWFKPVWGCVLCMASLWGTIGFVLLNYGWFTLNSLDVILTRWIVTIVSCVIANGIIWNIYGLLGNLLQYWEDRTK